MRDRTTESYLPHRQLRKCIPDTDDLCNPYLPHRQLRNWYWTRMVLPTRLSAA